MTINVASKNPVKMNAVKEIIKNYDFLKDLEVLSKPVDSNVSEQPLSLTETIQGAKNRANNSFEGCDLSFGIEDGLIRVPETKSGYMNVCVCAIFDGNNIHLGISSAFEFPLQIMKDLLEKNISLNEGFKKHGLTSHDKVGYDRGGIGILTKDRLSRKEYTKQAIMTALIHLENENLYQ